MSEIFEAGMLITFGISWPVSIYKSVKSRTARGKSIFFLFCVFAGYLCGITSKLTAERITYVLIFYCVNLVMVGCDIVLSLRNHRLDAERSKNGE